MQKKVYFNNQLWLEPVSALQVAQYQYNFHLSLMKTTDNDILW